MVLRLQPQGNYPVLSVAALRELQRYLLQAENQKARAVILIGAGRHFAAGADVRELLEMDAGAAYRFARLGQDVCRLLECGPFVSIAAVSGVALGGGTELALACDLRYCAPSARFGETGVNLGLMAGWGGARRLPALIGEARARDLLLTGRHFGAEESLRLGLVSEIIPEEGLESRALRCAGHIGSRAPLSVRATKEAVNAARGLSQERADEGEARRFAELFNSRDTREGLEAFLAGRRPEFEGN